MEIETWNCKHWAQSEWLQNPSAFDFSVLRGYWVWCVMYYVEWLWSNTTLFQLQSSFLCGLF